ncbi:MULTISPECIES: DUF5994 family protein [unclassified Streptomyces]|uniref:DUF5994 family protein n=1 Tax=unclassified Streptomyces TaxID=2593676 RepID=UPI0037132C2D
MTTDPRGPAPLLLLEDTAGVVQPVVPGSAVLRLETTSSRAGFFDGAWWPRSRDIRSQLPDLIDALTASLGPIARVGLDASAWNEVPPLLVVGDHTVRIDWSVVDDSTMIVTRGHHDHFVFLVIPPQTSAAAAHTAMTMAVRDGNRALAEQIFDIAGITPAQREVPRRPPT